MTFIRKLAVTGTASAAALTLSMGANAAVVVSGFSGGDANDNLVLTEANSINIDNDGTRVSGELVASDNTGAFTVGEDISAGIATGDVRFSFADGPAGIRNLVVAFSQEGLADQMFQVTDSVGNQIASTFDLSFIEGAEVTFVAMGTAFSNNGQAAEYNFNITAMEGAADAVPLPAAGLLFLTALGGAGFARSRRA